MTEGSREATGSLPRAFQDSPPPTADVRVEFGARSVGSALRPANEDHYLILRLGRHQEILRTSLPPGETPPRFDESGYAMLVADGVGANGAGEVASRLALTTLVHLVTYFGRWHLRIDDAVAREVVGRAERFFRSVDTTLHHAGAGRATGLQTTLTVAFNAGRDLFIVHVGHSRAYLLHDGRLARLTRDHTLAGRRVHHGGLVDINATARDLHHVLTETIGGSDASGPRIDIDRCRLADGDLLLLCTNGLTDLVGEDQIAAALGSDRSPEEQCTALVNLAVDAGSADDVTALVARYRIDGAGAAPAL